MRKNIININEITVKNFVESIRPNEDLRDKIDIGYYYSNLVIELFKTRPDWEIPSEKNKIPFARIKYVKTKNEWKLFWFRASEKWELYEPFPNSSHLSAILDCIKKDKHGCFFG